MNKKKLKIKKIIGSFILLIVTCIGCYYIFFREKQTSTLDLLSKKLIQSYITKNFKEYESLILPESIFFLKKKGYYGLLKFAFTSASKRISRDHTSFNEKFLSYKALEVRKNESIKLPEGLSNIKKDVIRLKISYNSPSKPIIYQKYVVKRGTEYFIIIQDNINKMKVGDKEIIYLDGYKPEIKNSEIITPKLPKASDAELEAFINTAKACIRSNQMDAALDLLKRAEKFSPGNPKIKNLINIIKEKKKQESATDSEAKESPQ